MLLNSEIINKIDSFFSKVFESLKDEFLTHNITAGVEIGSVSTDILMDNVVVEIDGVIDNVECKYDDMKKQAIIERAGYNVMRITKREWEISPTACIDRVRQALCA